VGVGIYTILMFAIGFWGYGKSRPSMEDFFLGGRTLGLFVVLCTVWSTLFSAYSYIGLPGAYYRTGISFFGVAGNILLNSLCMYLLGSRMWTLGKKHGFINMTDLFAERYGSNLVCVIAMIISIGSVHDLHPGGGKAHALWDEQRSVAMTRARDFLYVLWPQRYYFRPFGVSDRHTYAQLSRFISDGVLETMSEVTLVREGGGPDTPANVSTQADIGSRVRRIWD
jgi:hypothetical protein